MQKIRNDVNDEAVHTHKYFRKQNKEIYREKTTKLIEI